MDVELRIAVDGAVSVRGGRGRRVPQLDQSVQLLAAAGGARESSGSVMDVCAVGRRIHAAPGTLCVQPDRERGGLKTHELALGVRLFRMPGPGVVRAVCVVVQGPPQGSSWRERR